MPTPNWQFEALGTQWSIETADTLTPSIRETVAVRIEDYDKTYSRFRHDSLVWRMRTPGTYEFPTDVVELLKIYKKLYTLTAGRMTPLIGGMLEQAGYDSTYSLQTIDVLSDVPPFEALGWNGNTTLAPTEPIVFDVGAAGKGYLVDIISEILEDQGVNEYTIDASGDIKQKGVSGERVGLEHPLDPKKVIGTANLHNKSLCASAISRRKWRGLHHVFDPTTKQPTTSIQASWVIADTTLLADALATALFFVPATILQKDFEFSYVTMNPQTGIDASPEFDGELYI